MADFAVTLAEAATKMTTIIGSSDQAHKRLEDLHHQLVNAATQLDQEWNVLHHHVESLLQQIHISKTELDAETNYLHQSLQQLRSKVINIHQNFQHELEETVQVISELEHHIEGLIPDLNTTVHEAENTLSNLQSKVKETETWLQHRFSQLDNELQHEFTQSLHTHQAELEQHTTAFTDYLNHDLMSQLTAKASDLHTHLDTATQQLDGSTHESIYLAEQASRDSLEHARREQEQQFHELLTDAQGLESDMEHIKDSIDHIAETYKHAKDALATGCEVTNKGFTTAVGILHEWNEILERFV